MDGASSELDILAEILRLKLLRLKPDCFFADGGRPQAVRAISRINREIGESSSTSGTAVVCIRRTAL
jgi:hypothetical protein